MHIICLDLPGRLPAKSQQLFPGQMYILAHIRAEFIFAFCHPMLEGFRPGMQPLPSHCGWYLPHFTI